MRLCIVLTLVMCGTANAEPVSFRNDVMAVLSRAGCNQGTCHGNQHGKGGFKLSLRGQSPAADYRELTRSLEGRRVDLVNPDQSLLLLKPVMQVPHEGGRRLMADSPEYQILRDWISAGLPNDVTTAPRIQELQVTPAFANVPANAAPVEIKAIAQFSDGTQRDVTSLCVYDSSALSVVVSPNGVATSESAGLTTVSVRYLDKQAAVRLEFVEPRPNFEFAAPPVQNRVDELVFQQLKRLNMNPSPLCNDATFIRRAYLDLTGLLPSAEVAREFVSSSEPDKRNKLINRLLESPEFVDQQTQRWADLLRAEEKTLDAKGLPAYHNWIREQITANTPINELAARLIEARGSTYTVPQTNFYRALRTYEERAETTAQLFLGVRLTCAKCHNHPFDRWTQDDYYNWANFFARVDYEIIENKRRDANDKHEFVGEQIVKIKDEGEVKNVRTGQPAEIRFLGEQAAAVTDSPESDRLQQLAAWLRTPDNRRFAAAQANRVWFQVMGRGIVDPIDDFRATNPPVNPELFDMLTDEFVRSGFDARHLIRMIMNSSTYQLDSLPNDTNLHDDLCFSHPAPRRLTAEQTLDAIAQVLDARVPFGGHDAGTRAVQLVGVRNGEFRYAKPEAGDEFLRLFGKPNRLQSCECERTNETTLAQTFELVSGEIISKSLSSDKGLVAQALQQNMSPTDFITTLYWSALTRAPSPAELSILTQHIESSPNRRTAFENVAWAVLNSNEFLLYR
ncbi:MAG: DUF1549 domain-containing protein [Planctomycetaceae bacterium]|nr:DUF1549 domain-containing protein [Planctomycetaceae bacterium]